MTSHFARNHRVHLLAAATALALTIAAPVYAGQADVSGLKAGEKYSRFLVMYNSRTAPALQSAALNASLSQAALRTVLPAASKGKTLKLQRLRRTSIGADVVTSETALNSSEAAALLRQIAADPNVAYAEPDFTLSTASIPNDTRFGEQWHYANSAVGINAPAAWDVTNGAGVVVAVIDSGILSHNDLNANVLAGYDMVSSTSGSLCSDFSSGCGASDDGNGRDSNPADSSNVVHGTHVAGTIGAVTGNATGVAGVAYGAKLVPVRVLGRKGSGQTADIIDAITWASGGTVSGVPSNPNPAKVINMSVGGPTKCSAAMQAAVDAAVARGAVIVVAAGNFNNDVVNNSPAGCNNVVSVAASDRSGNRAYYSTYGAKIVVTAPGGEVCTPATEFLALGKNPDSTCTAVRFPENGVLSTVDNNGYASMPWQGTSMASPHVAGIAALIQSASKTPKTPAQVRQILTSTARPIAAAKCPGGCGAGLVDAAAAVNAAK